MDPAAHGHADDSGRYPSLKTADERPLQEEGVQVKHRLPYSYQKCSSVESCAFFKSTDNPLSSKSLIISTLLEIAAF
jgi:hypothetical protein